jgi:TolB protein
MRRETLSVVLSSALAVLSGCERGAREGVTRAAAPRGEAVVGPAGRVAFVSERDGNREIYAVAASGGAAERLTTAPSDEYAGPAGPGGRLLVVTRAGDEATGSESLARLEPQLAPTALARVGPSARFVRNPAWLPDGSGAIVESDLSSFRDLFLVRFSGGAEPERLTDCKTGCFEPTVSPDGKSVAFVSTSDGDPEVHTLDLATRRELRLTWSPGADAMPMWSPDGKAIAFVSARRGAIKRVFVMAADGSGVRPLRSEDEGELMAERDVAWSPDGEVIAFVAHRQGGHAGLRVVRVADGAVLARTDGAVIDEQPAWSPDGSYLAFSSNRDGNAEIYVMRRDGSRVLRLTEDPAADWLPRWVGPSA